MVDDLLLVAVGTQHHGLHHKIVFEERMFLRSIVEKDPNLCWLPSGNSSEIQVKQNQGNLSANKSFVCPGILLIHISPLPEEVALLDGFNGKYPSICYMILRFELPQINEVKNLIVNPEFP